MSDARQKLLDALGAFEDEFGSSADARDLITDARMLERSVRSFSPRQDGPSPAEEHMRERMGDGYDKRPKSFDDVAERHAERVAGKPGDDKKTPDDSSEDEKAD